MHDGFLSRLNRSQLVISPLVVDEARQGDSEAARARLAALDGLPTLGLEGSGSEFEKTHGWHVNLMPFAVLNEFLLDWKTCAKQKCYGQLTVIVPCVADLLISKLKRGEPRDKLHA